MEVFKVTITTENRISTDSDSPSLMANHALSTESNAYYQWITACGVICHMCSKKTRICSYKPLHIPLNIIPGNR